MTTLPGTYEALEQGENMQTNKPNTYRNRIVSVVSVALVMTGGAFLVASSRGSASIPSSSSVTNLAKASAAPQDKLPMKGDRVEAPKVAVVAKKESPKVEKKGDDEKKDVDSREIDGAKAKKTSKPTVKPTTPPKPTVPPTTKKPSEKKIDREEAPKGKAPPARSLAEKGNPSPEANPSTERAEGPKGAAVPVEKKGDVKEAPKEEKKDVDSREIDGAKAKKTSKPTVKPTTPPKPTVPPTTKKPSEKKEVDTEVRVEGPKLHPARVLAEVKKAAAPAPKAAGPVSEKKGDEPAAKKEDSMKVEAPKKDEKKDVESREIDGAKAKKTSKPTVKPTTPPKPTVPPTTKKPSEKKIEREEAPKGKAPPARLLAELGNPTPKSKATTTSSQAERAEGPKGAVEKKTGDEKEAPKEEKKDVDSREIDGAKAKKTSKPTVKPTTPPKPTVPPTTKKPSEKKEVETEKVEGPKLHPARVLSEVRGKVTPSSSSVRGGKGKTEKPVEGPPAPHAAPKGPRQLSAVPVTKDDADPCHDGLSPRCTPPTTKPVEHRSLADSPTKSPSSGLHKPTWAPSTKPVESTNVDVDTPVATPDTSSEESTVKSVNTNRVAGPKGATKTLAHDGAPSSRRLAGNPTKSPSSGLHKPTWKPSSKPNEHRELINKVEKKDADPCHDGLSPRCTPPTSKPVEHRSLAGSPTKSPSSGLHKPTWKPSSKPNEHRQ